MSASGISGVGGADLFGGGPLTLDWTTVAGVSSNSRPLFAPGAQVALEVDAEGIKITSDVEIIDDDVSAHLVSVWIRYNGNKVVDLAALPDDPIHFSVPQANQLLTTPVFAIGWNAVDIVADDTHRQVSMPARVYVTPDIDIPTITSPHFGQAVAQADRGTLQLTWTQSTGAASRMMIAMAELDQSGAPAQMLGFTVVGPDARQFDLGGRFGALMQEGKTYMVIVSDQVTADGLSVVGSSTVYPRNLITFSIIDSLLGQIRGAILLRSALGTPPTVLLFDTLPGQGTSPIAYTYALAGSNNLTWEYAFANLADRTSPNGYYVMAIADVLGNSIQSDPTTQEDDVRAIYGAPTAIEIASGARDISSIDLQLDNWPGAVHMTVTSTRTIVGDFVFALCPSTATTPPVDPTCFAAVARKRLNASLADLTAYNVHDGVYSAWAVFDLDGDGIIDYGLATRAQPTLLTVASDTQQVTVAIDPPIGAINGTVTTPVPPAFLAAVVYAHGVAPGPGIQPLYMVWATYTGGLTWSYDISYVANGDYDAYAMTFTSQTVPPSAVAEPASVIVNDNTVTQDFAF